MFFGELPGDAALSMESDIMTLNNNVSNSYVIDGNLGEDSNFQRAFGLVVDGV